MLNERFIISVWIRLEICRLIVNSFLGSLRLVFENGSDYYRVGFFRMFCVVNISGLCLGSKGIRRIYWKILFIRVNLRDSLSL